MTTRTINSGVDQLRILVTPEPSSAALVGLGMVGLGFLARRRRRAARLAGTVRVR